VKHIWSKKGETIVTVVDPDKRRVEVTVYPKEGEDGQERRC
jgi:hypothetical protein